MTAAPLPAELVSAALLGTARRPVRADMLSPAPRLAAEELSGDPAAVLLEAAALQDGYGAAGIMPGTAAASAPALDDPRPLLPTPAAARLLRLLEHRSPFLPEWLRAATARDYRAPDRICAQLLDFAQSRSDFRADLLALAGARGRWLAPFNPAWAALANEFTGAPGVRSAEVWQYGKLAERLAWLRTLRASDPAAARTALTAAWPRETGPAKAELLRVLGQRLDIADEPLLETALGERRADVRERAASLLTALPGSQFGQRMAQRSASWVRASHRNGGLTLHLVLPEALDAAARRDGIRDPRGKAAGTRAGWATQAVAATPLEFWERYGEPATLVKAARSGEWGQLLLAAWQEATLRQRDVAWARALFDARPEVRDKLFTVLPADGQLAYLLSQDYRQVPGLAWQLSVLARPWPVALAAHLLGMLDRFAQLHARDVAQTPAEAAAQGLPRGTAPVHCGQVLAQCAAGFPVPALCGAVAGVVGQCQEPEWQNAFRQLHHSLTQRAQMLEELS